MLSKEFGPRKIRVNALNPGATETEGAHAAGVMGTELAPKQPTRNIAAKKQAVQEDMDSDYLFANSLLPPFLYAVRQPAWCR